MTEAVQEIVDGNAAQAADQAASDVATAADNSGTQEGSVTDEAAAVAAEGAAEEAAKAQEQTWPDDWRERMAGNDEAFLKQLKRYSSPQTFAKGFQERETLIRSGKLKQPKPDSGDEKAMADWRKENGVPDDSTGYTIPDEIQKVLTDGDKPIVSGWFEDAHAAGFNQEQAQKGLEWYAKTVAAMEEQQNANDTRAKDACEDFLRKEWSHAEYKANTTLATRFLAGTPLGEGWADLRQADGRRLGDNPDFLLWAADQGRQSFGDVSFATGDSERKFADRKAEIEKIRDTDFERYDNDKAMRQELQDIYAAEERRKTASRR